MSDNNKVYVVWWDNGEPWEDNYQDIEVIFATREEAEEYLDARYDRYETKTYDTKLKKLVSCYMWEHHVSDEPYTCKDGRTECEGCPKYEEWFEAEEMDISYEEDVPCDEYYDMDDKYADMYGNETWAIHEFELGKSKWGDEE